MFLFTNRIAAHRRAPCARRRAAVFVLYREQSQLGSTPRLGFVAPGVRCPGRDIR